MKLLNFIRQMTTDRYDTVNTTARATWTGMTIYQINGATRKELAMYSLPRKWPDRPNMLPSRRSPLQSSTSEA